MNFLFSSNKAENSWLPDKRDIMFSILIMIFCYTTISYASKFYVSKLR